MENRLAIIINSCLSYYKKTIPVILESALNANIPFEHIYVVVGDSNTDIDMKYEEYKAVSYTHLTLPTKA